MRYGTRLVLKDFQNQWQFNITGKLIAVCHSLNSIEYWKKELLIDKGLEEFGKEFPFILCGNKVDSTIKVCHVNDK